jgi:hypothetical protein
MIFVEYECPMNEEKSLPIVEEEEHWHEEEQKKVEKGRKKKKMMRTMMRRKKMKKKRSFLNDHNHNINDVRHASVFLLMSDNESI